MRSVEGCGMVVTTTIYDTKWVAKIKHDKIKRDGIAWVKICVKNKNWEDSEKTGAEIVKLLLEEFRRRNSN